MSRQIVRPEPSPDPNAAATKSRRRAWPSFVALGLVPITIVAVDFVVEPMMAAGHLSIDQGNSIGFLIVFVPLVAALVLAARAVRAGGRAARWSLGAGIALTAAWSVLCVSYYFFA